MLIFVPLTAVPDHPGVDWFRYRVSVYLCFPVLISFLQFILPCLLSPAISFLLLLSPLKLHWGRPCFASSCYPRFASPSTPSPFRLVKVSSFSREAKSSAPHDSTGFVVSPSCLCSFPLASLTALYFHFYTCYPLYKLFT